MTFVYVVFENGFPVKNGRTVLVQFAITSLTTDASGAKVSDMMYCEASRRDKPCPLRYTSGVLREGEVRYTWTASLSTTPAYELTNYTFTGQFSYMDDPSTSGVAEGFGLMFYNARWYDPVSGRFAQADTIVPGGVQGWDRYAYASNNPVRYSDPTGHDVDCGIGDSYCNDARREYYYAWHSQLGGSFKTFLRAKDAYAFYHKHPNAALKDMFAEPQGGSWEETDAYTLANTYSEYGRHQYFNPVSDQFLVWEIDRLNAIKEKGGYVDPKYYWTLVFSGVIVFGPSEGGGGGYSTYADDWYRSTFPTASASAQYHFAKHGSQWSSIEEYTQAAKNFYAANAVLAKPWPINNGQEWGVKITTKNYFGIYLHKGRQNCYIWTEIKCVMEDKNHG